MICVDTTFLIDLWRGRNLPVSTARAFFVSRPDEEFIVPAHAAGEFLEGGATVSPERLLDSLHFVRLFRIGSVDVDTALHYARIVALLRRNAGLAGKSKPDLWIAAWAVQHSAVLVTRNTRHFVDIPDLSVIDY